MPKVLENKKSFTLSSDNRARLERFAPLFDIDFVQTLEGSYRLKLRVGEGSYVVKLSNEVAHLRLLTEICSRALNWIHFHFSESCRDSLLNLSNARIMRVAELYELSRGKRH